MKTVGPTQWDIYNGLSFLGYMEIRSEVGPSDSLKRAFDSVDGQTHVRLPRIVLSPYTKPNPKAFRHDDA